MQDQSSSSSPATKAKALLIDDDQEIRGFLRAILEPQGVACEDLEGFMALRRCDTLATADLVFLDLSLNDGDGVEVLRWLGTQNCRAGIILVSSFDERLLATALRVGDGHGLTMLGGLRKPVKPRDVRELVAKRPQVDRGVDSDELAKGIEEREIQMFHQPKVSVAGRKINSAEALVRWNHPRRGLLFPDTFIALAEDSGLMAPLTDRVLDLALTDRARWTQAGHMAAVAVNLSTSALTDLDLPNRISELLHRHNVPASALILEVTESTAMGDVRTSMDVLTRLRIMGAGVSIDDFGTGYSSLAELHRLPFTELKIDRSFVMDIHRNRDSRVIVDAIMKMAHAMDLKVVAEGVETEEHLDILADLNCDYVQGYYFSRPIPTDKFIGFMDNWTGRPPDANG